MTERFARGRTAVFEIWNWYKRTIASAELPGIPLRYWVYGQYKDSTPIKKNTRIYFRTNAHLYGQFSDPFSTGDNSLKSYLDNHNPEQI